MYFPEPDKAAKDGMELSVFDKVAGEFRVTAFGSNCLVLIYLHVQRSVLQFLFHPVLIRKSRRSFFLLI